MTIVAAKDSRNLSWANDTSSFGHRMLKKMGWTDGKGLGKKEDGTAMHLRAVRRTEETLGIGADTDAFGSNVWDQNKHNFSQVLERLKENHSLTMSTERSTKDTDTETRDGKGLCASNVASKGTKKKLSSTLETKSTQLILAQNRVTSGHAAKVRHSKDLSTKSLEDMAAILGMRITEFQQLQQNTISSTVGACNDAFVQKQERKTSKRSIEKISTVELLYEKSIDKSQQFCVSTEDVITCEEKCTRKDENRKSGEKKSGENQHSSTRREKKRKHEKKMKSDTAFIKV